jgi:hypothetical protein
MSARPHTGGCLCGATRFQVDVPLRGVIVCHCSLCRRAGTGVGAYTSAPRTALRLLRSEALAVHVDVNGRERSFCSSCGSALFWAIPGDDEISISAGALDGETGLRITHHVFVDSMADWETPPAAGLHHSEGTASAGSPNGAE